ncbi:prenyltransferase/squalene oxidase repeat-containing protein [Amycolatopsis sp. NPDC058278]|uniref:prenyltransferase/squalene oxidase repeat-containing protein n=1 Tax=Amycolatopsis sp. NPDC058278 TaxID=3346417 RepID=UPI0036DDDD3B
MTATVPEPALADGGLRQGDADLWCTYAAVRTLRRLGRSPAGREGIAAFVRSRRNTDGGHAWQRGLASDGWATYYCTQALLDLGEAVDEPARVAEWVHGTRAAEGGFAMTAGQPPDVWATYYATRTLAEATGSAVPEAAGLAGWLAALQRPDGGLNWQPGSSPSDARACYYGVHAWRATTDAAFPWQTGRLVAWLRAQQTPGGGFRFAPGSDACLWATFRAVRALRVLGAEPADRAGVIAWIQDRRLPAGGYERWPGYGRSDVWACFSAVGALTALGHAISGAEADSIAGAIARCRLPGSGYTYRSPDAAGDSLATAAGLFASVLAGAPAPGLARWLRDAQLPFEDGVMYMPGRGAEVRCTQWAFEALRASGQQLDEPRLCRWIEHLQNPDGGFGYWLGRGSDLVSTTAAVELADRLTGGHPATILDAARVVAFVTLCRDGGLARPTPAGTATASATAQAARVLHLLGARPAAADLHAGLAAYARSIGGYAGTARGLPELTSTYQVVLADQCLGRDSDRDCVARFLARVDLGDGHYSWSPLSRTPAGPLADCLGALLRAWLTDPAALLPPLNL